MVKVSIIVPIYNVGPFIARCLQSVMDQTYIGSMECVLVDDYSTDNSMAIVETMIANYHGPIVFRVLHHKYNRGQSAARNTGVDSATGDYVFFLDSDDVITPDCIELMAIEVEQNPLLEMVIGAYSVIHSDGARGTLICKLGVKYVNNNDWIRLFYFGSNNLIKSVVWNKLIKKSLLNECGIRFKEGIVHEDDHWSFFVYKNLSHLSIIKDCTYRHYIVQGSTMTTLSNKKTADSLLIIIKDWMKDLNGFGRSLQLFLGLELFLLKVFPYIPHNKTESLFLRFLKELFRGRQYRIAFYLFVNRWFKWRYYLLSSVLVREVYEKETLGVLMALRDRDV